MPLHPALGGSKTAYRRYSAATKIQSVIRKRQVKPKIANLKLNPTVSKLVQRKINKGRELKVNNKFGNRAQLDNLPNDTSRLRILLPNITQGTQMNQRIGSEVKLQSLTVQGCLTIPADDNVFAPLDNGDRADISVRLMCLSSKTFKTSTTFRANWIAGTGEYNKLFKVNAVAEAPEGKLEDMWKEINRDNFTVHYDKVYRMKRGVGYFPDATSTSGAAHMPAINAPFKINIKCKNKKLTYTDFNENEASNFAPMLVCVWGYTNGAAPSTSGVPFWQHYVTCRYYDN